MLGYDHHVVVCKTTNEVHKLVHLCKGTVNCLWDSQAIPWLYAMYVRVSVTVNSCCSFQTHKTVVILIMSFTLNPATERTAACVRLYPLDLFIRVREQSKHNTITCPSPLFGGYVGGIIC